MSLLRNAPCKNLPEEQKDLFYGKTTYAKAQKFCKASCPAATRRECLNEALKHEVPGAGRHGVWGGLSVRERNRLFGKVSE